MVVGNPDIFSIMFDVVDEWNNDTTFITDCYVFMVSNGDKIRILAASELQYIKEESTHNLQDINIAETYLSKEEFESMVEKLCIPQLERNIG